MTPTDGELVRLVTFQPYLPGKGPMFRLEIYSGQFGRFETGQERMGYRLIQLDPLNQTVLFEGTDFGRAPSDAEDSNAVAEGIMGFLCLRRGDTDADYFKNYTPQQTEFSEQHAEILGCEVQAIFCDENGSVVEETE